MGKCSYATNILTETVNLSIVFVVKLRYIVQQKTYILLKFKYSKYPPRHVCPPMPDHFYPAIEKGDTRNGTRLARLPIDPKGGLIPPALYAYCTTTCHLPRVAQWGHFSIVSVGVKRSEVVFHTTIVLYACVRSTLTKLDGPTGIERGERAFLEIGCKRFRRPTEGDYLFPLTEEERQSDGPIV